MKIAYPVRVEPDEDGGYWVQGLEPLANVLTEGATVGEALAMAREALDGVLESMLELGQPIPRPFAASGPGIYMIEPEVALQTRLGAHWAPGK